MRLRGYDLKKEVATLAVCLMAVLTPAIPVHAWFFTGGLVYDPFNWEKTSVSAIQKGLQLAEEARRYAAMVLEHKAMISQHKILTGPRRMGQLAVVTCMQVTTQPVEQWTPPPGTGPGPDGLIDWHVLQPADWHYYVSHKDVWHSIDALSPGAAWMINQYSVGGDEYHPELQNLPYDGILVGGVTPPQPVAPSTVTIRRPLPPPAPPTPSPGDLVFDQAELSTEDLLYYNNNPLVWPFVTGDMDALHARINNAFYDEGSSGFEMTGYAGPLLQVAGGLDAYLQFAGGGCPEGSEAMTASDRIKSLFPDGLERAIDAAQPRFNQASLNRVAAVTTLSKSASEQLQDDVTSISGTLALLNSQQPSDWKGSVDLRNRMLLERNRILLSSLQAHAVALSAQTAKGQLGRVK